MKVTVIAIVSDALRTIPKETGRLRNLRTSGDRLDYSIILRLARILRRVLKI